MPTMAEGVSVKAFNVAAATAVVSFGTAFWLSHATSVDTDVVGFLALVAAIAATSAVDSYLTYWQGR